MQKKNRQKKKITTLYIKKYYCYKIYLLKYQYFLLLFFKSIFLHVYLINFGFFKERVLGTMRVRMRIDPLTQHNQKVGEKSPAHKKK